MKLKLDFVIRTLDGKEAKDRDDKILRANEILANVLVSDSTNTVKFYDWALKLYNNGQIDIDEADTNLLKNFITDTRMLTNLGKKQILDKFTEEKK